MFHDETIYLDDRVAGRITSAAYGYGFDRPVGMGYLLSEQPRRWQTLDRAHTRVDIAGERVAGNDVAHAILRSGGRAVAGARAEAGHDMADWYPKERLGDLPAEAARRWGAREALVCDGKALDLR